MNKKAKIGVFTGLMATVGAGAVSAQSLNFKNILQMGGAIAVPDRPGPQIDSRLCRAKGQSNLEGQDIATKVVSVLSVGNCKAIGVVQVSGDSDAVQCVQAVAQIETRVPIVGNSRARA